MCGDGYVLHGAGYVSRSDGCLLYGAGLCHMVTGVYYMVQVCVAWRRSVFSVVRSVS